MGSTCIKGGLDWTCLRRRPRQTPAGSSGPQRRTRGTRLRRPRFLARSLCQLKRANKYNQILTLTQMSSKNHEIYMGDRYQF